MPLSLEAVYPFAIFSSKELFYHAPPNVAWVCRFLNLLKRLHPVPVLPPLAQFLKVHEAPDFQTQKAKWVQLHTTLQNVNIMGTIFHCQSSHKRQIEKWQQWLQKAVLEQPANRRLWASCQGRGSELDTGPSFPELQLSAQLELGPWT